MENSKDHKYVSVELEKDFQHKWSQQYLLIVDIDQEMIIVHRVYHR